MSKIGLDTPKGFVINNIKEGAKILKKLSFPIIIRPSFTLGGLGSGIAYTKAEFLKRYSTSTYVIFSLLK